MDKYNIMRMFCMFDLPVETEEQRRNYRIFRKELIQEGFVMIHDNQQIRTGIFFPVFSRYRRRKI